jgi:hypothetical protein
MPIAGNLYYEIKMVSAQKKISDVLARITKKSETRVYGVNTDKSSRDKMINDLLFMIISEQPELICSQWIFDDIRNLERKKTGKIEHRQGEHDDNLMSYLFVRYVLAYGNNLARFMLSKSGSNSFSEKQRQSLRNMNILSFANKEKTNFVSEKIIEEEILKRMELSSKKSETYSSIMNILELNKK